MDIHIKKNPRFLHQNSVRYRNLSYYIATGPLLINDNNSVNKKKLHASEFFHQRPEFLFDLNKKLCQKLATL
jgi:hypothetical protein